MKKPYAVMTEDERWNWHSEVYAFRRVVLGASPDEKISPPDPEGKYFNEGLIRAAARHLVDKRERGRRARELARDNDLQREGRGIVNAWAKSQGYPDLDAYAAAKGMSDITDAYRAYWRSPEFAAVEARARARYIGVPEDGEPDYAAVQEILGLAAKEAQRPFAPTPDEMAASRRQLGIEDAAP